MLSHQSLGGKGRKIPRSFNTWRSQESSAAVVAKAQYSASVDDLETVSCFLAYQVIGL